MRRRAKRDANHGAIVAALRKCGWWVLDLSAQGGGCPDLLADRRGRTCFIEIKNKDGRNRLEPHQREWHAQAPWPVVVVHSVDDVKALTEMGFEASQ